MFHSKLSFQEQEDPARESQAKKGAEAQEGSGGGRTSRGGPEHQEITETEEVNDNKLLLQLQQCRNSSTINVLL
jgi:hypothetical protein